MLLLLALGRVARADDTSTDVVVTGQRTPESVQRSSVRTDVVTREEADRRGATNVGEALAGQPGVVVNPSAYGYLGGVSAIQIQGLDRDRVLVLEDGERIIGDTGGAVDLANLPLADIARIEVVPGPMSALYGSSAIGGVVNVITAPPRWMGLSGHARVEGRSYGGALGAINGAYRVGDAWIGLDGNVFRQAGVPRDDGTEGRILPAYARSFLGLRAGYAPSPHVETRLRLRWLRDEAEGLEARVVPGLGTYLVDVPDVSHRYVALLATRFDLGARSTLQITLGEQWYRGLSRSTYRGSPAEERHEGHDEMHSLEAVGTFGDGPRTWVTGVRLESERFSQTFDKTTPTPTGLDVSHADEVPELALGTAAAYGQLAWKLGPLTVLPGVRVESHRRYGTAFAPRFSAALRASDTVHVRAAIGRGFRTPSAKELGFVFDHSVYGYRVLGNGALTPEQSWGVNGDVTLRPDDVVMFRLSGFANLIDALIDVDLGTGATRDGVTTYSYRNIGRAKTAGGQASATFKLGGDFRSEVAYDYLWTRDELAKEPLPGRAPHTVTLSLWGTLPLGMTAYARARLTSDAFVTREIRSPGWIALDVRLAHPLWTGAEGYLGVSNLLDVRQEQGRIGDLRPILGRVISIGVRASLPMEEDKP